MIKTKSVQMIGDSDWDDLVTATYGRPYSFQQQDGCKARGTFDITVPDEAYDYEDTSIPYTINGEDMGVSFAAWLEAPADKYRDIFWKRNLYPDVQMVANDLHVKGLLPAGDYVIDIDW
jgi:hypothetical protein